MKRKKMSPEEWKAEKARRDDLTRRLLETIERYRKLSEERRLADARRVWRNVATQPMFRQALLVIPHSGDSARGVGGRHSRRGR
jgi:hypothetical protein